MDRIDLLEEYVDRVTEDVIRLMGEFQVLKNQMDELTEDLKKQSEVDEVIKNIKMQIAHLTVAVLNLEEEK